MINLFLYNDDSSFPEYIIYEFDLFEHSLMEKTYYFLYCFECIQIKMLTHNACGEN